MDSAVKNGVHAFKIEGGGRDGGRDKENRGIKAEKKERGQE